MAIQKRLKERLSEEQIQEYMKWEERWRGKKWNNQKTDELLTIVLPGYKRLGEVISSSEKTLFECTKGHKWDAQPSDFLLGVMCPTCSLKLRIRPAEDVYKSIKEKHNYEMSIETYQGTQKKAKFKCPHGNLFWGTPSHVERGLKKCQCKPCKQSRKIRRRTKQECIDELKKLGFIINPEDWKNGGKLKAKMWCVEGQHWTEQRPQTILSKNSGCAICSRRAKHSLEKLKNELFGPEGYIIQEGAIYKNSRVKIPLICPNGHECSLSVDMFKRGQRCKQCYVTKQSILMMGKNNPSYNPDKTDEERENDRSRLEYDKTREACFRRDGWKCKVTGENGVIVHHHLDGYNWNKERRYDLNNVITISEEIHDEFHNKYGRGDNTRNQFIEFLSSLIEENRYPERKQYILNLIDWIEETRDKIDFNHLEVIKEEGTSE